MDKDIIDNNKKIARFMDFVYVPYQEAEHKKWAGWRLYDKATVQTFEDTRSLGIINKGCCVTWLCRNNKELKFNTHWEWIMSAWKFILNKSESLSEGGSIEMRDIKHKFSESVLEADITKSHEIIVMAVDFLNGLNRP